MKNKKIFNLVLAAMFLALAQILPLVTGNIPAIGKALSPMHIPVLLCGFCCGWPWGLGVGIIAPLLRSVIFGMPVIFPNATGMAFELATYGAVAGILYNRVFAKKKKFIYPTLIIAMIAGRLVWGLVRYLMLVLFDVSFSMKAFLAGAVTSAVPGIILHLLIIPPLVLALEAWKKKANAD